MQAAPRYDDVVAEVAAFLEERLAFAVARGHPRRSASASTRASASARPSSTTSSSSAGSTCCVALGRPVRRRLLAQALARPAPRRPARDDRHDGGQRRRRRRGVRARRDDLPRPRRPRARRGAARRRRRRVMRPDVELARPRAATATTASLEEERRARAALPLRRRARGGETPAADRPDRGRRRLPRRRRGRARRVRRQRASALLEALAAAVADALLRRFPSRASRCACASRRSCSAAPVEYAAVTARRRAGDVRAYVGLGANLGDREATIRRAIALLGDEEGVEVVGVSTLRETDPVGVARPAALPERAPPRSRRELAPRALLERLLAVERELGRTRDGPRWGPRTIDLDLLLYGDERVDEPGLTVPHPRLARAAVRARAARRARPRPRRARARPAWSNCSRG